MAKFCISCGAANSDSANMCNRCGKMLPQKEIEWKQPASVGTAKKHWVVPTMVIAGVILIIGICFLLYRQSTKAPQLSEQEAESVLAGSIEKEKASTEEIFQEGREHDPVTCEIADITQDGTNATVTYKMSAHFNYADRDVTYRFGFVYDEDSEMWMKQSSERDDKWNYHDLEGVWQEKNWRKSMTALENDDGPSTMTVEKIDGGYKFTATENWVSETLGSVVEIKMDELGSQDQIIHDGSAGLFAKGYQSEQSFQRYNLSPEEGITDMEKIG